MSSKLMCTCCFVVANSLLIQQSELLVETKCKLIGRTWDLFFFFFDRCRKARMIGSEAIFFWAKGGRC